MIALSYTTIFAHVLASVHPDQLAATVRPLALDVAAGKATRDEAETVLAAALDALVDFKSLLPGVVGDLAEAGDHAVFARVVSAILDMHLGCLVGAPNGPAAHAAKPTNAGEWFQRLLAPAKYAEQHPG